MPSQIFTNIKQLVNVRKETHVLRGAELAELPIIEKAYLIIEDGIIAGFGEMKSAPKIVSQFPSPAGEGVGGEVVLPCWCDSHLSIRI